MSDCLCDLSRCTSCDEARDAELRRTFPNEGEVMEHDYRDVLLKAASLVEEGWCTGNWYMHPESLYNDQRLYSAHERYLDDAKGEDCLPFDAWLISTGRRPEKVCLEGAIRLAVFDLTGDPTTLESYATNALVAECDETVAHLVGIPDSLVYEFNDVEGRTADEVADALRRAAE